MKPPIRSFVVALLATCVIAPWLAIAEEATVVDGIAAVVNGDVITYSQVRALTAPREKLMRQQLTGKQLEQSLTKLRELALKDLIDRRLVIQAFKKESYEIPDHVVDERMHQIIRESFGGDRNTFIKTLEAQNYTLGEFKEKQMESIIVQAMRSHNVKMNAVISPTKVEEYYRIHRDQFTTKEQIKLRMIMVSGQHRHCAGPKSAGGRSPRQIGRWRRLRWNGQDLFRG